ncbi:HNH endonuclease signature motif containing protein [Flavobacterium sp. FlaQc-48]|uniref:HNH endonuclease signature motif containing protein n=1 Tax=Flavobacterium sp. FlaQc-48 TaxID=3374181 RepID=UPI003756452A
MVDLEDFKDESECIYKVERYSVRDNGTVSRHPLEGKRPRPTDNNWTFGKLNSKTGYLEIASVRVHRIVATAFHGEPPTKEHVVDHIDTNKQNNRPANLRWVTRLENILLNPITARRIELICGSVEAFLADPSKFRDKFPEPNYQWMCAVSAEEAQVSLKRMQSWAKSDIPLQGGSLGEWIFGREIIENPSVTLPDYIMSKTHNAAQRIVFNFEDKPNEYPSTPQVYEGDPLTAYHERLTKGATFFRNHNGEYVVVKSGFSKDKRILCVLTRAAYVYREQKDGEWQPVPVAELSEKVSDKDLDHSLAEVTFENGLFIHGKAETGFHPTEELEELFDDYIQGL